MKIERATVMSGSWRERERVLGTVGLAVGEGKRKLMLGW